MLARLKFSNYGAVIMRTLIILTAVAVLIPFAASAQSLYQEEREKIRAQRAYMYDDEPLYNSRSSADDDRTCFGYCDDTGSRSRHKPTTPEIGNSLSRTGAPKGSMGNNILYQLQPR